MLRPREPRRVGIGAVGTGTRAPGMFVGPAVMSYLSLSAIIVIRGDHTTVARILDHHRVVFRHTPPLKLLKSITQGPPEGKKSRFVRSIAKSKYLHYTLKKASSYIAGHEDLWKELVSHDIKLELSICHVVGGDIYARVLEFPSQFLNTLVLNGIELEVMTCLGSDEEEM